MSRQINSIQPFVTTFKTDQVIISKDELVNEFHLDVLKELKLYGSKGNIINFIGILIICTFLFILYERFLYYFYSKQHRQVSTYILSYTFTIFNYCYCTSIFSTSRFKVY